MWRLFNVFLVRNMQAYAEICVVADAITWSALFSFFVVYIILTGLFATLSWYVAFSVLLRNCSSTDIIIVVCDTAVSACSRYRRLSRGIGNDICQQWRQATGSCHRKWSMLHWLIHTVPQNFTLRFNLSLAEGCGTKPGCGVWCYEQTIF